MLTYILLQLDCKRNLKYWHFKADGLQSCRHNSCNCSVDIEELLHEKQLSLFNRSSYDLESNKALWKQEGGASFGHVTAAEATV